MASSTKARQNPEADAVHHVTTQQEDFTTEAPTEHRDTKSENLKADALEFALKGQTGLLDSEGARNYALGIGHEARLGEEETTNFRWLLSQGKLEGPDAARFTELIDKNTKSALEQLEGLAAMGQDTEPAVQALTDKVWEAKAERMEEFTERSRLREVTEYEIKVQQGTADVNDAKDILTDRNGGVRLDYDERRRAEKYRYQMHFSNGEAKDYMKLMQRSLDTFRLEMERGQTGYAPTKPKDADNGPQGDYAGYQGAELRGIYQDMDQNLEGTLMDEAKRITEPALDAPRKLTGREREIADYHMKTELTTIESHPGPTGPMDYVETATNLATDITDFARTGEAPDWWTDEIAIGERQWQAGDRPWFQGRWTTDEEAQTAINKGIGNYERHYPDRDPEDIYALALLRYSNQKLDGLWREKFDNPEPGGEETLDWNQTGQGNHAKLYYANILETAIGDLAEAEGAGINEIKQIVMKDADFALAMMATDEARLTSGDHGYEGYSPLTNWHDGEAAALKSIAKMEAEKAAEKLVENAEALEKAAQGMENEERARALLEAASTMADAAALMRLDDAADTKAAAAMAMHADRVAATVEALNTGQDEEEKTGIAKKVLRSLSRK